MVLDYAENWAVNQTWFFFLPWILIFVFLELYYFSSPGVSDELDSGAEASAKAASVARTEVEELPNWTVDIPLSSINTQSIKITSESHINLLAHYIWNENDTLLKFLIKQAPFSSIASTAFILLQEAEVK